MEWTPELTQAVTSLIVALVTAGGILLTQWAQKRKARERATSVSSALEVGNQIHQLLNEERVELRAKRVLVLLATNGGSIPRPGCPLRSSVVYENFTGLAGVDKAVLHDFQGFPLDGQYMEMLTDVVNRWSNGREGVMLVTSELPRCDLQAIYESTGVTWSYVSKILRADGKLFYLSVVFGDDVPVPRGAPSTAFRHRVRLLANKIRNLLEPHYS